MTSISTISSNLALRDVRLGFTARLSKIESKVLRSKEEHRLYKVPACVISGGESMHRFAAEGMLGEMYERVRAKEIHASGHYVAEENPKQFVEEVLEFIQSGNEHRGFR